MAELNVLTINIWSGFEYTGLLKLKEMESSSRREERFQGLIDGIKQLDPDVIVMNEANPMPQYANRAAALLDMDYISHPGVVGVRIGRAGFPVNLREADVILAKKHLNLKWVGRKHLSGSGFVSRYFSFHFDNHTQLVLGKVTVDGKDLYIGATHWFASPDSTDAGVLKLEKLLIQKNYSIESYKKAVKKIKRDADYKRQETQRMVEFVEKTVPANSPLIVMGDFNAAPNWEEISILGQIGWKDVFSEVGKGSGLSWDPEKNSNLHKYYLPLAEARHPDLYHQLHNEDEMEARRLDYIFVKDAVSGVQLKPASCEMVFTQKVLPEGSIEPLHVSDHFGFFACILISNRKE